MPESQKQVPYIAGGNCRKHENIVGQGEPCNLADDGPSKVQGYQGHVRKMLELPDYQLVR